MSVLGARDNPPDDAPSAALLHRLRAHGVPFTEQTVARIKEEVPGFDGSSTGRRHQVITMAVNGAATQFLARLRGQRPSGKVDQLYGQMGHGEATDGNTLDAISQAIEIARSMAWAEIRDCTVELAGSAAVLSHLEEILDLETAHLHRQVRAGYQAGRTVRDNDPARLRRRLVAMLVSDDEQSDLALTAARAGWALPSSVVVVAIESRNGTAIDTAVLTDLSQEVLHRLDESTGVLVCRSQDLPSVRDTLEEKHGSLRCAASWPVPPAEAPDAYRWARRALELARRGIIAGAPYIDCAEHRSQIWLHSEPLLRQRLVQDLLPPLLAETPNSREILSETLLDWLESRDSAPAIAARLGVHPQTVRYRWKRINELFGDALHEPAFVVQVTMLLKASVPLWKAGDQSDFERFHTEEGR